MILDFAKAKAVLRPEPKVTAPQADAELFDDQPAGPFGKPGAPRWLFNADVYEGGAGDPLIDVMHFNERDGYDEAERLDAWADQLMRCVGSLRRRARGLRPDRLGMPLFVMVLHERGSRATSFDDILSSLTIEELDRQYEVARAILTSLWRDAQPDQPPGAA